MKQELIIEGMSCGHCVGAVREALEGVDSLKIGEVQIGRASIDADEKSLELAKAAVEEDGYKVVEVRSA
ncbi:MAG: heavy-metal-associated domain-containing protein [Rhodothermales bacterium]|nr:heavy-metal-associated domain-containing protein [Rhodothermales bacterium]